jgi:hypothetical protein
MLQSDDIHNIGDKTYFVDYTHYFATINNDVWNTWLFLSY